MKKIITAILLWTVLCVTAFTQNASDFKIDGKGIITGYDGWDTVITIPAQINGIPVTAIGDGAFKNMGITGLTLPAGIVWIGKEAFRDNKLTSLVIPAGVRSIDNYAFSNNQLTSLTINSNVLVFIGQEAFSKNKLTNLRLGNNVIMSTEAFSNNQLTSVTVGDKVTIWTKTFSDNKLTSLTMGGGGYIAANAFYGNGNLKNLVLGAGITIDRDAFKLGQYSVNYSSYYDYMCNSRKAATYDNLAVYAEKKEVDYSFVQTKYGVVITNYTGNEVSRLQIPGRLGGAAVTGIGDSAFKNKNISRMQLPESLVFIDNNAFASNPITGVTIPNSVTGIGSGVFANCEKLTSITIPDSVTTSIGVSTFYRCYSLTSVIIGNGVTSIGNYAFFECRSLTSVTIGNSVTSIGDYAFSRCTSLASVTIGNGVTSIGERAFSGCDSLTNVTIPNSVTSIGDYAFSSCTSLTNVTIPDSVTRIGESAFWGTGLTSITIPDSVTSIGDDAFRNCSSLTSVTFRGTIPADGFHSAFHSYGSNTDYLRDKYLAEGPGTYTRSGTGIFGAGGTWTKQQSTSQTTQPATTQQQTSTQTTQPAATGQPAVQTETPVINTMVRINGGTFTMGSPENEPGRYGAELQHKVTVDNFYMSKYEITQKEYQEVMGTNPSRFKGDNLPVENVSWYDAIEYCNKRSQKEGLTVAYTRNGDRVTWNQRANGYRLPTEAEWEYTCRAGTTTAFNNGNNDYTNTASVNTIAWYKSNSGAKTRQVGLKTPNAWGLYDMHGNVNEWCWDWAGDYTTSNLFPQKNPVGPSTGAGRILRGGHYNEENLIMLRSAVRAYAEPDKVSSMRGFRIVRL